MFEFVGNAWAGTGVVPITAALTILVSSIQGAGGGFVALKCCWLGITWRRGTEHGMDEFSAIGISAALIVGATIIGQAIGGVAGMPLTPAMAGVGPLNEVVGDLGGSLLYLTSLLTPGLYLCREKVRGFWRHVRRLLRCGH
jgi:hypothetical protein